MATNENETFLNKNDRGRVIRETANMMMNKYGMYPNRVQYNGIASALNHLYPQWTSVILIVNFDLVILIVEHL